MTKIVVILLLGYLVFKIIKNGAYLTLENIFKPKRLEPEELVQCVQCERFISKEISIKHKKLDFCGQDCIDKYISSG